MKPPINIAILAHVDAGKTSITEQLLYYSGAIKKAGNVDKGTAASDFLQVEKERGISVVASHVSLEHQSVRINIIDTPGHSDFMSEVERSLMAVDMVVLIVSAADGVQAQTRVLWSILEKQQIPRILLVNKVDRRGVVIEDVMASIHKDLSAFALPVQSVEKAASEEVNLTNCFSGRHVSDEIIERLAETDDRILESYLQGDAIDEQMLRPGYNDLLQKAQLFPVLFSVAKKSIGIEALLDEMIAFSSLLHQPDEKKFSAVVFKISHHPQFGKLSYIRVFSGRIEKKQLVYNQSLNAEEKVNQIKAVFSNQLRDVESAGPGEIVAIAGFSKSQIGDVLGQEALSRRFDFNTTPILKVQVKPVREQDYSRLSEVLTQLDAEDPLLQFQWFKEENEFHIKINGWIQIEILKQILLETYQLETEFLSPTIIYKETPRKVAIGYDAYTMPKPCWAVVKFKIEVGERGSGVQYSSEVGVNDILLKYQKEVERSIPRALEQGIKAWEVTDIKITLIGGEDHVVHSRAGDFVIATPMAILNGLQQAGTDLLEPMMTFVIRGPEEMLGQISSDIHHMRGRFDQPVFHEDKIELKGIVPAATSLDYAVKLASRSGGKAGIQMQFHSYEKVADELGVIREYKGISPLDRAKYILKARKAIQ